MLLINYIMKKNISPFCITPRHSPNLSLSKQSTRNRSGSREKILEVKIELMLRNQKGKEELLSTCQNKIKFGRKNLREGKENR